MISLGDLVDRKKRDLSALKARVPIGRVGKEAERAGLPRDFAGALRGTGVSLIAELKKASPSAGLLRAQYDVSAGAQAYAQAGAKALSVLTEENYFLGHLDHLRQVKDAVPLPVLRKDFIFDEYQIFEARAAGADAVLLIVALLEEKSLRALFNRIQEFRELLLCFRVGSF